MSGERKLTDESLGGMIDPCVTRLGDKPMTHENQPPSGDCAGEAHDHPAHDWRTACLKCGVFKGSDLTALRSSGEAVAPEGWVTVPAKPTDQMYVAFRAEMESNGHIRRFVEAYGAMLAASPRRPPSPKGVRATDGWQLIETAPKTGRFLACAIDSDGPNDPDPYECIELLSGPHSVGGEQKYLNHNSGNYTRLNVTHWQPLPKPPALTAALEANPS